MTETAFNGRDRYASSDDRNLAMVSYALLFAAPFVFGLTALIAVVIAYVRKTEAEPITCSHYRYQIRNFWVSFALSMVAVVGLTVGIAFFFAEMLTMMLNEIPRDAWQMAAWDVEPRFPAVFFVGVLVFISAYILSSLWIIVSSVIGMLRLTGQRAIGRS
jgi:uncharacterized membrane protein